jgi:hypothetical protein
MHALPRGCFTGFPIRSSLGRAAGEGWVEGAAWRAALAHRPVHPPVARCSARLVPALWLPATALAAITRASGGRYSVVFRGGRDIHAAAACLGAAREVEHTRIVRTCARRRPGARPRGAAHNHTRRRACSPMQDDARIPHAFAWMRPWRCCQGAPGHAPAEL